MNAYFLISREFELALNHEQINGAFVFGSIDHGTVNALSDIDLMALVIATNKTPSNKEK